MPEGRWAGGRRGSVGPGTWLGGRGERNGARRSLAGWGQLRAPLGLLESEEKRIWKVPVSVLAAGAEPAGAGREGAPLLGGSRTQAEQEGGGRRGGRRTLGLNTQRAGRRQRPSKAPTQDEAVVCNALHPEAGKRQRPRGWEASPALTLVLNFIFSVPRPRAGVTPERFPPPAAPGSAQPAPASGRGCWKPALPAPGPGWRRKILPGSSPRRSRC